MSKRFKGETCVYCSERTAITADHIFAREFFLESARANLPQAPACEPCNNAKSKLELYLTAVLPFGGRHPDALQNLASMVPKRMRGNAKLHRALSHGQAGHALPLEGERLEALMGLIARGLAWHHWEVYLDDATQGIHTLSATEAGARFYDEHLFKLNSHARVTEDVGNGSFRYEGVQADEDRALTLWRFSIYGGITMGDGTGSGPLASQIIVITAPKPEIQKLDALKSAAPQARGAVVGRRQLFSREMRSIWI
jgi:hypothetical protein